MHKPRISIIMPTFNTARFIQVAIESIIRQSFNEWELIVMDGGSTDGTLDLVERFDHPNIRVFSEQDEGAFHAITKGFEKARGDYFTTMCGSDGYVDNDWLQLCVDALDSDAEVSLVWGAPALCAENGTIGGPHPAFAQFLKRRTMVSQVYRMLDWKHRRWIPRRINRWLLRWFGANDVQKENWLFFWLDTGLWFPDLNMCYRRLVYKQCMPPYRPGSYVVDEYMPFYFNFNRQGFLPLCIPRIANFGRTHADQGGEVRAAEVHQTIAAYHGWMRDYSRELRKGGAIHVFRDGTGKVIGQYCCCSR
jgi:glycosyltransferase involved in cell wall biosynthesis